MPNRFGKLPEWQPGEFADKNSSERKLEGLVGTKMTSWVTRKETRRTIYLAPHMRIWCFGTARGTGIDADMLGSSGGRGSGK